jgi:hypothetical protein
MKKFTKVLENLETEKLYKAVVSIELNVSATSEGEAGYLVDNIIGGIEEQVDYTIEIISELGSEEE